MVMYEDMQSETRLMESLINGGVTVLAVHHSRGLAFVRENITGRIRTAKCNINYKRGDKVDMFKTGVVY